MGEDGHAFVVESFIDELAHAVREDPLEFRLKLLRDHPRPCALLEKVAEESDWGTSRGPGRGRGIAQHFSFGSYAAASAEVSVDAETGTVRVERIVCAIDCGSVVSPDGVAAQLEGATCMGLSAALKEQIRFENGGVASSNFQDYPLLSMSEAPEIAVHLVESGNALGGVGEPGVPPVAPAVANAVFDAVGLRIRRLPMTPDRVKQAAANG
jgi:isoquinoline 1-oxidoreductase beta subunit